MKAIVIAAAALLVAAGGAGAATQPLSSGSGTYQGGSSVVTFSFDASGIGEVHRGRRGDDALGTTTAHVGAAVATAAEIVGGIDTSPVPPGHAGSVGSAMTVDVTTVRPRRHPLRQPDRHRPAVHPRARDVAHRQRLARRWGTERRPRSPSILDGPLSATGWYTGDVAALGRVGAGVVRLPGSSRLCVDVDVNLDTPYLTRACTATSSGGRNTDSCPDQARRDSTARRRDANAGRMRPAGTTRP